MTPVSLPIPSKQNRALSQQLTELIKRQSLPISFSSFMELALYEPNLGYYNRPNIDIGSEGDFITAPTLSPIFARCLAKAIQYPANILEIGAGTGQLAFDLLTDLFQSDTPPTHYFILEKSEQLKQKQQELLQQHPQGEVVTWLDDWPEPFEGTVIANEVLDAMPVHCFEVASLGFNERCVDWDGEQFIWRSVPAADDLLNALNQLNINFSEGYCSEINLNLSDWIKKLSGALQKGQILLIDYGNLRDVYYHPHHQEGTLRSFYQHRVHDNPLLWPGLQDITADVDFTAVAKIATSVGLSVVSLKTQANFLLDCGLAEMIQPLSEVDAQWRQSQALKKLLEPNEMGERIKVLELLKY